MPALRWRISHTLGTSLFTQHARRSKMDAESPGNVPDIPRTRRIHMIRSIASAVFCAALLAAPAFAQEAPKHASVRPLTVDIIDADGHSVGTATLSPAPNGVNIRLDIKSLPPGPHMMHIHQYAKCYPPDFKSAGPHFAVGSAGHVGGMPAGDIPNFVLTVRPDGTAHTSVVAPAVTMGDEPNSVFSNGGTAIVIHAVDAGVSASAPPRIACGAITRQQ